MQEHNTIQCLIVDDEAIARDVLTTHLSKIKNVHVIAECKNALEAFNYISNHTVDLVFLDINMPEISGISFAKSINKDIKIIFTTAYRDYAVEGFELKAVDYLLKPITFERLLQAINTYFEVHSDSKKQMEPIPQKNNFIFVRADRMMIKIDFDDIIYIESFSDYLKLHLNNTTVITRETISAIEARLPSNEFIRIHRSFIVSLKHISSFTNEHVTVNNKALTISRSYKQDVLNQLEQY